MFRNLININNIKRSYFILHHPSKVKIFENNNYYDYSYPYKDNIKCEISYTGDTNDIKTTNLVITNLNSVSDIYYLDSYLSYFSKSKNTIQLLNPNLYNLYMYISSKNLYRNENEFIIHTVDTKYNKIIPKLLKINEIKQRKIWKF